jgi:thiol-disulfide isomerase/thioredoxin
LAGVDLEGNPVDLGSYLGEATLVLSFWSIHCSDCIRELDDLRSIRREFPPEDVTVIAVNTDSGLPTGRIAGFMRRYEASRGPLDVVHLLDREAIILDVLGIRYIPVLVVVDRSGRGLRIG